MAAKLYPYGPDIKPRPFLRSVGGQEILKNRNDFYDPTYEFDYPSHVPSERAANSKGVG